MTSHNICVLPECVTEDIDTLVQVQELAEKGMTQEGRDRFRSRIAKNVQGKNEAETIYGKRMVSSQCKKLAKAINEWLEEKQKRKAGNKTRASIYLTQLDAETVAFIALKSIVNSISNENKLVFAARQIGACICDEVQARRIAEENKQDYNVIRREADKKNEYHRKIKVARYMAGKRDVLFNRWSAEDCILVGKTLIELIVMKLGLVDIETIKFKSGKTFKTAKMIVANKKTMKWIDETCEKYEDLSPIYEPMVVPPLPWTTPFDGGYLTPHIRPLSMVKANSKEYLEQLATVEMPEVYEGINKIQNVPYRVNKDMLDVIHEVIDSNLKVKGLPTSDYVEEPTKPHDIETNAEARRAYAADRTKVIMENMKLKSQRAYQTLVLNSARKYQDFEAIWIPQQLDFRGRVYSVTYLNPQGEDYVKSLLTFAEGKPLGTDGVKWLAIHISNVWGNDKVPFEHRELWTHQNTKQILSYVEDPFTNRGWMKADKPFQFLAACFEWYGYITEGEDFVSHIGVALDGSCSGLQNFGMALKCEETGKTVNLTPSDKPADIYQDVIDDVTESMKADLGVCHLDLTKEQAEELAKSRMRDVYNEGDYDCTFDELFTKVVSDKYDKKAKKEKLTKEEKRAQKAYLNTILPYQWLVFGMSRKTAKRSVMTYPYGSKQYGFGEQVRIDILKPAKKKADELLKDKEITEGEYADHFPFANGGFDAATYIAEKLWNSVRRKVKKAAEAMDWLQEVAKKVANQNIKVKWETPLGFVAEQHYSQQKLKEVETTFLGKSKQRFALYKETDTVNSRKQASSVSPNFIHSLDATHLMMTVLYSDLTNWALVHDSFSTLAADTQQMYHDIRNAFFRLYSEHDVLEDFYQQMLELVPEEERGGIPKPPSKGQLDLALIYESQYSFA